MCACMCVASMYLIWLYNADQRAGMSACWDDNANSVSPSQGQRRREEMHLPLLSLPIKTNRCLQKGCQKT